jgi:pimeloyl-ACP methyl ester carboxylesterase
MPVWDSSGESRLMQTHHQPSRIPFGEHSEALWAVRPTGKALLFVHGFGGSAVTTWLDFPSLLQQSSSFSGHDLIFYGYDGLRTRARPSADLLIRFLDALFSDPAGLVTTSLPRVNRPPKFTYKRVVIVAHSLGAVVSRIALVDAIRKRHDWTSRIRLVLFAPAHQGAHILPLATLAMGALRLAPVEAFARYRFQALRDLEENCQTLTQLSEQTRKAIRAGAKNLIAKRVVHAGQDRIVNVSDFCDDPPPEFIHDASHSSVCKPRAQFLAPLDHVLAHI